MALNLRYKLFVYFSLFNLSCNVNEYKSLLNEDKVYLFFRESKTKLGYIAQLYNINDVNYSHVGIGVMENSNLFISHIFPNDNSKGDLNIDSYEAFFWEDEDIIHGTVIEIKESNHKHKQKILTILKDYKNKNIFFDKKFGGFKDENYCCSEFVCEYYQKQICLSAQKRQ